MTRRSLNAFGFLTCAALLGYGYYLQYVEGLQPCPLCMLQRLAIYALAAVFLLAALHHPGSVGARLYGALLLLAAGAGAALSVRHIYLQNLPPDQVPTCGPDLDALIEMLGPLSAISQALQGSGSCAEVSWQFLGMTIPGWTLAWFIALGVVGLIVNWRAR